MNAKYFNLPEMVNNYSAGGFETAYVPELLQSMLRAYKNDESKFVWKKIFPEISVNKVTGKIANLGMQAMSIKDTTKGFKGGMNKIDFGVELNDEWTLKAKGLYTDVYLSEIENADSPIDAQRDKMFILNGAYDTSKEYACLSTVFDSSVVTNYVALSQADRFDNVSSGVSTADPIAILLSQAKLLKDKCGAWPTQIVLALDVMVAMLNNTKVIDRFQYTTTPTIPSLTENLKNALGTEIIISEAQYWDGTGGIEGTLNYMVSAKILMVYNEAPSLYSKGFAKTFIRKGEKRVVTAAYPEVDRQKQGLDSLVAVQDEYDMHIIDLKCARLITTVIG